MWGVCFYILQLSEVVLHKSWLVLVWLHLSFICICSDRCIVKKNSVKDTRLLYLGKNAGKDIFDCFFCGMVPGVMTAGSNAGISLLSMGLRIYGCIIFKIFLMFRD